MGYNLTFGTINAKMWRVFYIFHNPQEVKKRVSVRLIILFTSLMQGIVREPEQSVCLTCGDRPFHGYK